MKRFVGPVDLALFAQNFILASLLDVSEGSYPEPDQYTARMLVAALVHTGSLGRDETSIGEEMKNAVAKFEAQNAIDGALLWCSGEMGARVAQVFIDWGANPDIYDTDDEVSALCRAVITRDEPMIRCLLKNGADPKKETDTTASALELVRHGQYASMA